MYSLVWIILPLVLSLHTCTVNCDKQPIVNTSLGKVKGFILKSRLGKPIYSFTGIRYAKAPVNELRFQVRLYLE